MKMIKTRGDWRYDGRSFCHVLFLTQRVKSTPVNFDALGI